MPIDHPKLITTIIVQLKIIVKFWCLLCVVRWICREILNPYKQNDFYFFIFRNQI